MATYIIETSSLNFGYDAKSLILDNINLKIEKGSIYGFLGPNGAGKTTTIRLLLGLLKPVSGNVEVLGCSHSNKRLAILKNVGAMIETPTLYDHLTGVDNLEIARRIHHVRKERIHEVLEIVKLTGALNTRVKAYSLGMKQRLGVAISLLSEPQLLILDEPTNGLDPHGIIETRELLLRLNKDFGTTILVSSHLLTEIEKLATHVGILTKGKLVFQGTIHELLALKKQYSSVKIKTNNNQLAAIKLQHLFKISFNSKGVLEIPFINNTQVAQICKILVSEGLEVYQIYTSTKDLEKTFLEITSN